ncbi:MAG: ribonuclease III [Gammaproteobacteria bacterium]|nr:ribonuclease III [Gammaproteobacteria bacterium]
MSLRRLCSRLGYTFTDERLLQLALSHRSVGSQNNERLEYLGDAVLGCVIAEELFRRFPDQGEGALSRLRAHLVKGESLAALARDLALGDNLILGQGELRSGGVRRDSILAGALEAIIGAVHLNGGVAASRALILEIFGPRLAGLTVEKARKDPKTRLQELLQSGGGGLPEYRLVDTQGSPPSQEFHVTCHVPGMAKPLEGRGSSRRKAEQDAAGRALEILVQGGNRLG